MYDKFADYMYYLLTSPLKRVKKAVNQWYILFKVLGARYDMALSRLSDAQDETMLATCDPAMLQAHAEERGMTRYANETDENFRIRIANYSEILRLGGTDEGVLLAVRALGFADVRIALAKTYRSDDARWAEFYILINLDADDAVPIGLESVKAAVRAAKYVGARDRYEYNVGITDVASLPEPVAGYRDIMTCVADNQPSNAPRTVARGAAENKSMAELAVVQRYHDLFYWDGEYTFDGTKVFDAYIIEDIIEEDA